MDLDVVLEIQFKPSRNEILVMYNLLIIVLKLFWFPFEAVASFTRHDI